MSNKPKEEINYCFLVEWFDSQADLVRKYQLFYFTSDNTIEMFDTKNRRTFLKRCPYPSIKLPDLCIGAQIAVYSRQLKVVAYGDDFTRKKLESQQERTFTLIKPDAYDRIGKILDTAVQNGMSISRIKMCRLSSEQASNFLGKPVNHPEVASFSCGPSVAVELVGVNAVDKWSSLQLKGVYSSLQQAAADKECSFFFDNPAVRPSAHMQSCTVAIIKPHLVQAGAVGKIVDAVLAKGYEVSAIELFQLPKQSAEEFLEVYQTVVPEYFAMAEQLASGPCVVLEIKGDDKIVSTFREFVGPMDPEIAKHIRPNTLRAQYGVDRVKNGIHCTDLPEDGQLESEFFFSIMQPQA